MNKIFAAAITVLCAFAAMGQNWPRPAATPVACAAPAPCVGKFIAPYSAPLAFSGRYLDSSSMREWQPGFRTARARRTAIVTDRNRVYMIVGSAFFAYDLPRFVSRLTAGEAMVPATVMGAQNRGPIPETFLLPDLSFYAERSAWDTSEARTDGQDRLYGFDWDDRGFIYLAVDEYGLGALADRGSMLESMWQQLPGNGVVSPHRVLCVKASDGYYLIASDTQTANLFYVGSGSTMAHERRADMHRPLSEFAKSNDGRVATIEGDGRLRIYNQANGILVDSAIVSTTAPAGNYYAVDSDGTNFYATSGSPAQPFSLTIMTSDGKGGYNKTTQSLGRSYEDSARVRYGAGGYLLVWGTESFAPGTDSAGARNLRLYKISGTSLAPVPLQAGAAMPTGVSREYFANAYHATTAAGYAAPGFSGLDGSSNPPLDARIFEVGGNAYLLIAAGGLGDVYSIGASPSPQPCPTFPPPAPPPAGCTWVTDTTGACPVPKLVCTTPQPQPQPNPQPSTDLSAVRASLSTALSAAQVQVTALQSALAALDGVTPTQPPVVQPPVIQPPQPPVIQPPVVQPPIVQPPTPTPQPQPQSNACTPTAGSPPRADGCRCTEGSDGFRWRHADFSPCNP